MARMRTLKPGFFTNDSLAEIAPLGRLLFAGLWTIADREGRLEYRPKKIKAELLPYDDCDVLALIADLVKAGFLIAYTVADTNYLQVTNFLRHQCPNIQEKASIIPAPTIDCPQVIEDKGTLSKDDTKTIQEPSKDSKPIPLSEQNRTEQEGEQRVPTRDLPPPLTPQAEVLQAICVVTAIDIGTANDFTRRDLESVSGKLARDGETAESVGGFASWYARENFNGQQGRKPSLRVFQDRWGEYREARRETKARAAPVVIPPGLTKQQQKEFLLAQAQGR